MGATVEGGVLRNSRSLGARGFRAFLSLNKRSKGTDDRDDEYRNFHLAWIMCFQSNLGLGKRLWSLRDRALLRPADGSIQVVFTITVM